MKRVVEPLERKKVAIVGSGCSGIAALWALKDTEHDVYLYEADSRLGGHANTVQWKAGKYSVGVDTGFIVFNTATYPNFLNFLKKLNVTTEPTDMAFGVSRDHGLFEWSGKNWTSLFCQTRNLLSLRMWRMLFDIVRFNQFVLDVLINAEDNDPGTANDFSDTETIGEYLDRHGYSDAFRDGYLIPMTAAVWSTSPEQCIHEFPIITLIRVLWNHHKLSTITVRPEWLTLKGGARSYIDAVMKDFPSERVFLNSRVERVENDSKDRVVIHLEGGQKETFDHVILATHGDQALSILGTSATEEERSTLSCFETSQNEVVLHSDLSHMPRRRSAWSSLNYMTLSPQSRGYTDKVSLTYNMNTLQHIPEEYFGHVFATLNPLHEPDPALTQGRFFYSNSPYTPKAIRAQKLLPHIQNTRGISYAGAWTNYGFHEDGFSSGLLAAQGSLGAKLSFRFVDSSYRKGRKPELTVIDYLLRLIFTIIQLYIVQPLERILGIDRRPIGTRPPKDKHVKHKGFYE